MNSINDNVDLLYIEDNEDFIDFVGMTIKKIDPKVSYQSITDGVKAKNYFENLDSNSIQASAKLILLDYNLPGMKGIDLLKHIRSFANNKHIPVVFFSSSDNPYDIESAYASGANGYIVKPIGLSSLKETMESICHFWLQKNQRA